MSKTFLKLICILVLFLSGCSVYKTGKVPTYVSAQTDKIERDDCFGEGQTVPMQIKGTMDCCPGLKLIPPPSDYYVLVKGICTNCGNNHCDEAETRYNCPEDCYS